MGDINFLAQNKNNSQGNKSSGNEDSGLIDWTEPSEDYQKNHNQPAAKKKINIQNKKKNQEQAKKEEMKDKKNNLDSKPKEEKKKLAEEKKPLDKPGRSEEKQGIIAKIKAFFSGTDSSLEDALGVDKKGLAGYHSEISQKSQEEKISGSEKSKNQEKPFVYGAKSEDKKETAEEKNRPKEELLKDDKNFFAAANNRAEKKADKEVKADEEKEELERLLNNQETAEEKEETEADKDAKNSEEKEKTYIIDKNEVNEVIEEEKKVDEIKENDDKERLESLLNKNNEKKPKEGRFFVPNKWEVSKIIKTNLIQNEDGEVLVWRGKIIFSALAILAAALIIGGGYGFLYYWEKDVKNERRPLFEQAQKIKSSVKELEKKTDEAAVFEKKLNLAAHLIRNHIYWTNFFKFLEENILTDVYLISGATSGSFGSNWSFSMVADKYSDITNQVRVFKNNEYVKEVKVTAANLTSEVLIENDSFATGTEEVLIDMIETASATGTEEFLIDSEDEESKLVLKRSKVGFNMQITLDPSIFTK